MKDVATKPIDGQKTGTSGLRKKTKEFMSNNYLGNWVQSLFNALGEEAKGKELGLGGDGRWVEDAGVQPELQCSGAVCVVGECGLGAHIAFGCTGYHCILTAVVGGRSMSTGPGGSSRAFPASSHCWCISSGLERLGKDLCKGE